MYEDSLYHHGILGQKWGIRRFQPYPKGSKGGKEVGEAAKKGHSEEAKETSSHSTSRSSKSLHDMSDDELRSHIQRLELERKYRDLVRQDEVVKVNKGKAFVSNILEASVKNIGTQATTYMLGTMVNKLAKQEIVNPKKGQKDK